MSRGRFFGFMSAIIWTVAVAAAPESLNFSPDGKFKIVQFTDIHFELPEAYQATDAETLAKKAAIAVAAETVVREIAAILDAEKPDLVVFTGDNVLISPELLQKGWETLTAPIVERHLPWVAVMGNHDPERGRTSAEIVSMLAKLPGSLDENGPETLGGGGNFLIELKSDGRTDAALYFLDSGRHADPELCDGYAWLSFAQIAWFREQSKLLTEANSGIPLPALAFFHIPFPEFIVEYDLPEFAKIGARGEEGGCPKIDSGMFAAMLESRSVVGVFVGHDHDNDYALAYHGICLGYGRKTGPFSYHHELASGARVIELSAGKRNFTSWIRSADGKIENRFVFPDDFPSPKKQ